MNYQEHSTKVVSQNRKSFSRCLLNHTCLFSWMCPSSQTSLKFALPCLPFANRRFFSFWVLILVCPSIDSVTSASFTLQHSKAIFSGMPRPPAFQSTPSHPSTFLDVLNQRLRKCSLKVCMFNKIDQEQTNQHFCRLWHRIRYCLRHVKITVKYTSYMSHQNDLKRKSYYFSDGLVLNMSL